MKARIGASRFLGLNINGSIGPDIAEGFTMKAKTWI